MNKPIGILGMACRFVHMPDLADYWYFCVNHRLREPFYSEGNRCLGAADLLTRTVNKAFEDMQPGIDPGGNPKAVLMIYHEGTVDQEEKSRVESKLGYLKGGVLWYASEPFKGFKLFKNTFSVMAETGAAYAVLAVLSKQPVPECAAVVFGVKQKTALHKAYAFIQAFQTLDQKAFENKMAQTASQGSGYLCVFDDSDKKDQIHREIISKNPKEVKKSRYLPYGIFPLYKKPHPHLLIIKALICWAMGLNNKIMLPSDDLRNTSPFLERPYLYQNTEIRPWIQDAKTFPRLCFMTELSFYETIPVLVLQEVSADDLEAGFQPRKIITDIRTDCDMVVISGPDSADIVSRIEAIRTLLELDSVSLEEVAAYYAKRFDPGALHRLILVAKDTAHLKKLLKKSQKILCRERPDFSSEKDIYHTAKGNRRSGKLAWLFPGLGFPGLQGAYSEHLMSLCLHFPECRQVFDDIDMRDRHPQDPVPTSYLFFPPGVFDEKDQKLLRKRLASPRIEDYTDDVGPSNRNLSSFGVTVANWSGKRILEKLNIVPDAVFGQSLGELSALCAGGAIRFSALIDFFWEISLEPEQFSNQGRLAFVGAGAEKLEPFLKKYSRVVIAVHNGIDFQILGGETKQMEALIAEIKETGVWTQFLPYPAIHTPNLTEVKPLIEPFFQNIEIRPFDMPVYSGITSKIYADNPEVVRKLMIDNIDHPVLLWQTVRQMYNDGIRIMVQVGGGATMYSQARTNIGKDDFTPLSIDVDYRSAWCQLNHLCAALLEKGVDIHFAHLFEHRNIRSGRMEEYMHDREQYCFAPHQHQTSMPFMGDVLKFKEQRELVVNYTLDLIKDAYIRDHVFVNAQTLKPVSSCLPVVPMTMSLEIMAEIAACLVPGYGLVGFENVIASKWISLADQNRINLRIAARQHSVCPETGMHRVDTAIYIKPYEKPVIEGRVLFGKAYVSSLNLKFTSLDEPLRYPISPEQTYREKHLFHGPVFQCVTGEVALTGNKVISELEVIPKTKMFEQNRSFELLSEPVLLDGAAQLVGLWAVDQEKYVLPIGFEKLEIYGPGMPLGTKTPVLVEIKTLNAKLLTADIEIQDGSGNVWMRIKNWKEWIFGWPKTLYDFSRQPKQCFVSQVISIPQLPEDAVAQYVCLAHIKNMDLEIMARYFLHDAEMEYFSYLSVPVNQVRWMLKIIACKDALRRKIADGSKEMMHPVEMVLEDNGNKTFRLIHPDIVSPLVYAASSKQGVLAMSSSICSHADLQQALEIIEASGQSKNKEFRSWP